MKKTKSSKKLRLFLILCISLFMGIVYSADTFLGQAFLYQILPMQYLPQDQVNLITTADFVMSTFNPMEIEQDIVYDRYIGIIDTSHQITVRRPNTSTSNTTARFFNYFSNYDREWLRDVNRLLNRFYSMDQSTGIIDYYFDIDYFIDTDFSIAVNSEVPQVLIFHSHAASEFFIDSANTHDLMEGVVGVGATLANILATDYNLGVIHYKGVHDMLNGQVARMGAYERIELSIRRILEEHPTIEVIIDLHRDGVPATANRDNFRSYVDGRPTASIMFVNGVSAIKDSNGIRRLNHIPNPYLKDNLAFSFNLQMAAMNKFSENFLRRIYLTPFRYINHLRPNSILLEVGTQLSTKEEAHNAMIPFAEVLYATVFSSNI